jgi:hypothetical protein
MRRTLREVEPQRPSTFLTTLSETDLTTTAHSRHVEAPRLIKSLKGDLDWIVMKALEKDRRRRYETANALAMDIQRYLQNEPVMARPPSRFYRLRKLVLRNKVVYASGIMVAVTLMAGLGISTRFYFKEREARLEQAQLRRHAEYARTDAERARIIEMQLRQAAEAREKITQAAVLMNRGATEEADALLDPILGSLLSPSMEATAVFRSMGLWNLLQGRWRQAANRYLVLVQVNQVDKDEQSALVTSDLLMAAPLLIEAGDVTGYDQLRRETLARLGGTPFPGAAEQLIKISLLLPADDSLMALMVPLAKTVSDSLVTYDPAANEGYFLATWRAFALALLEYRRGNYNSALEWLEQCSSYSDQSPSCVASVKILGAMAWLQLGDNDRAAQRLGEAREMVKNYFSKKLEPGDNKSGKLEGWIMTPIFLREAEALAARAHLPTTI